MKQMQIPKRFELNFHSILMCIAILFANFKEYLQG